MQIDTTNPINGKVQGPESSQKINPAKRENEEASGDRTTRADESPDDRISLSEASRKAASESAGSQSSDQAAEKADLSETEAERLARQASTHLAQTNASISNQAVQKAVDLFT